MKDLTAANKTRQKIVNERREKIKDYVSNRPGEWISSLECGKRFGISDNCFRSDFKAVVTELGGAIESVPGRGMMYVPVEKTKDPYENLAEDIAKAFGYRNGEGYKDPTAGAAIEKADAEIKQKNAAAGNSGFRAKRNEAMLNTINAAKATTEDADYLKDKYDAETKVMPRAGEVWECSSSNGSVDMFLIIKVYAKFCSCLKLYIDQDVFVAAALEDGFKSVNDIVWNGNTYNVIATAIGTKPNKYVKKRLFRIDKSKYDDICDEIANLYRTTRARSDEETLIELEDSLNKRAADLDIQEEVLKQRKDQLDAKEKYLDDELDRLRNEDSELSLREEKISVLEGQQTAEAAYLSQLHDHVMSNEEHDELVALRAKCQIYERLIFDNN